MDNSYIKTARVKKKYGVRELARILQISPAYVSKVENNHLKPGQKVLKEICRILDIDYFSACRESLVFPQEARDAFFNNKEIERV